ncbi:MAG TPA: hypothetical protein DIU15_09265 [Deltaproteobacteria bacterium]|nr:hypothetical protein [Deltaproteobacteria bacterium]HCP46219.1 hypothetical protein [Deltaproteobacteria bacterium]
MRHLYGFLVLGVCLGACGPSGDSDDDGTPGPGEDCDNDSAPEVVVQEVASGQPVGFAVDVVAQVSDPQGINTVSLYYRTEGAPTFAFTFMSNDATGSDDLYMATIPASVVQAPGVDYYVRATDQVSPCTEETFSPAAAPDEWDHFETELDLSNLPYYADFDGEDACAESSLASFDWLAAHQSFPQSIHNWRLDDRNPLSGDCSASHSEGIPGGFWECPPPDGEGTIVRKNWLISPPMDFRGKDSISVRWFERRVASGLCGEAHQLYVSTGAPDPDAGDYQLIADLALPGSAWTSSEWHDISAYSGSETVYVALYYEGGSAGRWQVDDFYVGEPLADLRLVTVDELSSSTGPGSSAVALNVTVENVSETYASTALTATLTSSDPAITISGSTSTLPALEPLAQAELDGGSFSFDIGSTHPDNSYLDFAMLLDDGLGHQWTIPIRLLLGEESSVTVGASAQEDFTLELGHGSPEAPDYSVEVEASELVDADWVLNVTSEAAHLPPGPGSRRWFVKASNSGSVAATLDSAVFTVGGVETAAEHVPLIVEPGQSAVVFVPQPPDLHVQEFQTSPESASPGVENRLQGLQLRNDGAPTAGPVSCVLGSPDADATGFDTAPVTFGETLIGSGEVRTADGDFVVTVGAGHTDNSPVALTLLCTDGSDTDTISFELPIPYAHPVIELVRVDDSDGDDDGLADAGELVDVYVTIRNDGAFATDEAVEAVVSAGDGSTAVYTLSANDALDYGSAPLEVDAALESSNSFQLNVDSSALLGDSIVLDVVLTAGSDSWTEQMTVEVTGLPWLPCPEPDDPMGDVVSAAGGFDIKGCSYRSDGEMLQVKLDSWTEYDPSILFLDFFFYEVPNQYSVESVGGNVSFEDGCVFGDDLPTTVPIVLDLSSPTAAIARVSLDDMNILGNNTQVAFGSGSCPNVYFCDTYPAGALTFTIEQGTYNCDGDDYISINW